MSQLRSILTSPYLLWIILALPSAGMLSGYLENGNAHELLHPTGEFSARFMIIAMIATPLRMLFPTASFTRWLVKTRRYFGVAAFFYAAFHTYLYIVDEGSLNAIIAEIVELGIWTGWLAFIIFIPLAITSNDYSVRKLLSWWKPLQRWVYAAAVLTLMHWIFIENQVGPALVHFIPLAGLEIYRIRKNNTKRVTA